MIRTLLTRAEKICTSITDKDAEREHVTRALSSNGYPKVIVDRNRPPTSHPTLPPHEQETPKAVVTLPYIRHLLESIHQILTPLGILPPPFVPPGHLSRPTRAYKLACLVS